MALLDVVLLGNNSYHVFKLIALATASLTLAYMIGCAVYNIYFHPLANYPGPFLARATRLWYVFYTLRGDLIYTLRDLHAIYGDVVRTAPDELSYTAPEAWNDIYGHRQGKPEMIKDPAFYSSISSGPGGLMRSERTRHSHLRKAISHGFSDKSLRSQEHVVRKLSDQFLQRMKEKGKSGRAVVNIVDWFNFFTFDVMGSMVLGESFGCLETSEYHFSIKLIFDSVKTGTYVRCGQYWPVLAPLVQWFLVPADLGRRRAEYRKFAIERANQRREIEDGRDDLVSGFLKPDSGVTQMEYQGSTTTLILGGSETTATLMSGLTYYLLKNTEKMKKAVDEVRTSFKSIDEIDFVGVNKLTYLLACINEALRLYPPVADGFPRNTMSRTEIINGQVVPPNTIVKVTQWSAYHLSRNFTRPDEFVPERWLDDRPEFANDKREVLQAFSTGPRNCVGRNLAIIEMRLLMALLLYSFDIELDPRSEGWDRQKVFLFWEKPALLVKLRPREFS